MTTVNSLSGGQTSSFVAANFPADFNVFALVTTNDKNCQFPDSKIRQIVSDKIGREFVGTLEDDLIIWTMLELEQFIGQKIHWVVGQPFEHIIQQKKFVPDIMTRFCTTELKIKPIFDWWIDQNLDPIETRIGFRANEMARAKRMIEKTNSNGFVEQKTIVGRTKNNAKNKWANVEWQKPTFPLIENGIFKDQIIEFWKNKPVKFAPINNCVGCFHRNEVLLNHMSKKHPNKFDWFVCQETENQTFKKGTTYEKIKKYNFQFEMFDSDFGGCDSGHCGI
jgi:hypothetical protein